jgi:hypothetical protein
MAATVELLVDADVQQRDQAISMLQHAASIDRDLVVAKVGESFDTAAHQSRR